MQRDAPMCIICKHHKEGDTCDAFPDGIPSEIFDDYFDHRKPYPGDKGIRFEPKDGYSWEDFYSRFPELKPDDSTD